MSTTRRNAVRREEQLKLINECRRSGLTDAEWCRQNAIPVSTFYNWISRIRKTAADQIEPPSYGHSNIASTGPEVVQTCIVPDGYPEMPAEKKQSRQEMYLDNSHTIEIAVNRMTIRVRNDADPVLLAGILHVLQEHTC